MSESRTRAAIGSGAATTLAIAVPATLLAQVLDRENRAGSGTVVGVFVVILVAFGVGGFVAARRAPSKATSASAGAAVIAFAVVQGIALIRLLAQDEPIAWAAIPVFALIVTAVALAGGLAASRRANAPDPLDP